MPKVKLPQLVIDLCRALVEAGDARPTAYWFSIDTIRDKLGVPMAELDVAVSWAVKHQLARVDGLPDPPASARPMRALCSVRQAGRLAPRLLLGGLHFRAMNDLDPFPGLVSPDKFKGHDKRKFSPRRRPRRPEKQRPATNPRSTNRSASPGPPNAMDRRSLTLPF